MNIDKNQQPIVVTIRCVTYNHEPYIRQCLDGFVMQKTNFRFEAIVHDDASTDGTAAIVKEYAEKYPDIIKPIFETENQYSKRDGSIRRIMNDATSKTTKYIALCEGDDYWTDPLKLQKQFDFMEANPEYGLVYTKAIVYNQASNKYTSTIGNPYNNDIADIILKNPIPTLTVMIRKDILFKYSEEVKPQTKNWKMGDYPMWIYCSIKSKIKFIDVTTAVYRELSESASHSKDYKTLLSFKLSTLDIQKYYIDNYNINNSLGWSQRSFDIIKLNFYIDNMILIARCNDKKINNEQYRFLRNNKLYGLLMFCKLFSIFKSSRYATAALYRASNFCIKWGLIKSRFN